jgi:hypothetical protein
MRGRYSLRKFYRSLKLIIRADGAFALSSEGKNELALQHIRATEAALGPLSQYPFGVELRLLEIFSRGCLDGIKADDYDFDRLKEIILAASEYNDAERLHLLVYLEELAATAGVTLSVSEILDAPASAQRVSPRLVRRFPKLSDL